MKQAIFRGTSLEDLRSFPEEVKREAGYQIDRIQKKTQRTSKKDIEIARTRFQGLMKEIRDEK